MDRELRQVSRYLNEGKVKAAKDLLRPLLTGHRDDPHVCCFAARLHILTGDFLQAKRLAEEACARDDNLLEARYLQAYCHMRLEEYPEAVNAYRRIIAKNPHSAVAHLFLADCLSKIGKKEDAIENLLEASRLDSDGDIRELAQGTILSLKESL